MVSTGWQADLDLVRSLAPPPSAPFGLPVDWARFEADNGFLPPDDFRALFELYGAGWFESGHGELEIPEAAHPDRTYLEGTRAERDALTGHRREFPEYAPAWPAYPAPGGFLPIGGTGAGWTVGWLAEGSPNDWPIAIDGGSDGWYERVSIGIVGFVVRWLSGDLGLRDVERDEAGAPDGLTFRFEPPRDHACWDGRTCHVLIEFGPTAEAAAFASTPREAITAELAPAQVRSFGAFGDATRPVHVTAGIGYRPDEEPAVMAAVARLAARLGTSIATVTALDGSPGWPASRQVT